MPSFIPRTALPGRSQSAHDVLAKNLGYFSLAVGAVELLAPRMLCRMTGLRDHEALVRGYGAREVANGVAILASHDATPWVWGRVLGDTLDIATVIGALRGGNEGRFRAARTLLALIGISAIDVLCAGGLSAEKGGPNTAVADYRDRSGFPKGVEAARGAARDFEGSRGARSSKRLALERDQPETRRESQQAKDPALST
ncbi:MAG: cyclase dehydrase [Rhodospirillales bacterium]|jgi:hypothetical protein|nr:cyclase dehydrase [Rhodospirillales bacterium]